METARVRVETNTVVRVRKWRLAQGAGVFPLSPLAADERFVIVSPQGEDPKSGFCDVRFRRTCVFCVHYSHLRVSVTNLYV